MDAPTGFTLQTINAEAACNGLISISVTVQPKLHCRCCLRCFACTAWSPRDGTVLHASILPPGTKPPAPALHVQFLLGISCPWTRAGR